MTQKYKRTLPDFTGRTFNFLKVLNECDGPSTERGTFYLCECVCGNKRIVSATLLHRSKVTSCGCRILRKKQRKTDYNVTVKPFSIDKNVAIYAYGLSEEFFEYINR